MRKLSVFVNMLGRYSFDISEAVINGELRALRNPADDEFIIVILQLE